MIFEYKEFFIGNSFYSLPVTKYYIYIDIKTTSIKWWKQTLNLVFASLITRIYWFSFNEINHLLSWFKLLIFNKLSTLDLKIVLLLLVFTNYRIWKTDWTKIFCEISFIACEFGFATWGQCENLVDRVGYVASMPKRNGTRKIARLYKYMWSWTGYTYVILSNVAKEHFQRFSLLYDALQRALSGQPLPHPLLRWADDIKRPKLMDRAMNNRKSWKILRETDARRCTK